MIESNDNYEYQQEPFSAMDKYNIYSMSDNGYKKYFNKNSYNYNFLRTKEDEYVSKMTSEGMVKDALRNQAKIRLGRDNINPQYENRDKQTISHVK